ncbi:MAG: DNA-processing protein DprA [Ruminococcus sp.]|jgi:DNA processing protein|nr:DNA-processing protein DprA [Ruminococcus sp.]
MSVGLIYPVSEEEKLWFKLSLMFEPGSNRFWEIDGNDNIASAYKRIAEKPGKFFRRLKTPFESHVSELADNVITNAVRQNIGIITYANAEYPDSLREIYNPPMAIYYQGDVSLLKKSPCLGIVGARASSVYALDITDKLIRSLRKYDDYVFVSGFALGTDIAASLSAVRSGGKTIAVKACGIDYNYPAANMRFVPEIVQNGVIISEYPPGAAPNTSQFIIRNRIIAALADGVVVTEGSVRSGTISTAHLATDFGKDVFVLPPRDITDPHYGGNSQLIRDGAIPLLGIQEVLIHNQNFITGLINLEKAASGGVPEKEASGGAETVNSDSGKEANIPGAKNDPNAPPRDYVFNADTSSLPEESLSLLDIIKASPGLYSASSLADNFGNNPDDVLDIIMELELENYVFRAGNGMYY